MIDTDKYDNIDSPTLLRTVLNKDAPLLLEEVKRLREALRQVSVAGRLDRAQAIARKVIE